MVIPAARRFLVDVGGMMVLQEIGAFTSLDQGTSFNTPTFSNQNLTITSVGVGACAAKSVTYRSAGKFYFECSMTTFLNGNTCVGVIKSTGVLNNFPNLVTDGFAVFRSGNVWFNGAFTTKNVGAMTSGDLVGVAIDLDNVRGWIRKGAAGLWLGDAGANPATNTNGVALTGITPLAPIVYLGGNSETVTANFGGSAFTGAVPAGFTAGWPA